MALGHHRRVHLSVPVLLCLALQGEGEDRGRARDALRLEPGLEQLQRPERAILPDPKECGERTSGGDTAGEESGGDCVSESHKGQR
jgi:hypothetical protein